MVSSQTWRLQRLRCSGSRRLGGDSLLLRLREGRLGRVGRLVLAGVFGSVGVRLVVACGCGFPVAKVVA